ncbi:ABC transporter ATP-binding protein [Thiobacter aerophilum]|uniref:ABC transporter ATP-binding protein n=1 Tax=Thiobacter aerophilum TaxID=3121275 RepID=A0ABV0EBF1_9BURK
MTMTVPLLEIQDLRVHFNAAGRALRAVDGVSLTVAPGETVALVGESGCGKSVTALSVMRLLPPAARIVGGSVRLDGTELMGLPEVAMRRVRGARVAMIFQEPMTSLNPVLTIGQQIAEPLVRHKGLSGAALSARVQSLLEAVNLPDPARIMRAYPHQLSGGMKQRAMMAMAVACEPRLLIADEPTTALDVTIQAQVLALMRDLQRTTGMGLLFITHDLGVVAQMADRVAVMYAGEVVESAPREAFFRAPRHPYTRKLFASLPGRSRRGEPLAMIPGMVPTLDRPRVGCRFATRCEFAWDRCRAETPAWVEAGGHGVRCHLGLAGPAAQQAAASAPTVQTAAPPSAEARPLLTVRDLKVHFPIRRGVFQRTVGYVRAVDGVSLDIASGRTLALVGESGCGKTTVGKGILQLVPVTGGSVSFEGRELMGLHGAVLRRLRSRFQIVFQDPFSSLNPRMTVADILEEGMLALGVGANAAARQGEVDRLLAAVGLPADAKLRYPHEFSGGQRQRIAIARALAVQPRLIVCDEPTSALDVSVQAQILNLLLDLQQRLGLSYLFITHNLAVVEFMAQEVAVMYLGRIVEKGAVDRVLVAPAHPYTQALLSAVPTLEPTGRTVIRLAGEPPSPARPPQGCHFHPRCPQAMPVCRERYPEQREVDGRKVACHLYP